MNAFTFPAIETAPLESRPLLEGPQGALGFLPNLLAGLANAPPALAAYADLGKHFAKVGLTGIEMQAVLVVASVENACAYCVAAHSTFATKQKIDPAALDALRHGRDPADPKLAALATFVRPRLFSEPERENGRARILVPSAAAASPFIAVASRPHTFFGDQ